MTALSGKARQVIMSSLTKETRDQYERYIRLFQDFCAQRSIPYTTASITDGIEFLTSLFYDKALKYSGLNTARSALSLIINTHTTVTFGKTEIVKRFMTGTFKLRPTFPRYTTTYDVSIVLQHLKQIKMDNCGLKELSLKLIMLLSLLTGQRNQSLAALDVTQMVQDDEKVTFFIPTILKTTKPGKHIKPLVVKTYPHDTELCPVTLIHKYLKETSDIREGEQRFFLSYKKPHKAVCSTTLARWCKEVLAAAGVNVEIFKAHSTRGASTSMAESKGLSLLDINKAAGWSNACGTFAKFYQKPISKNFGEVILDAI